MALELVTGYAGSGHISAADVAGFQRGMIESDNAVLETKQQFAIGWGPTSGTVRISAGDLVAEGRHFTIPTGQYEDIAIPNLVANMHYAICIKYERNVSTGVESASFVVLQGTADSDPEIPEGSIEAGDPAAYFPLYSIYNGRYKRLADLNSPVDKLLSRVNVRAVDFQFSERDIAAGGVVVLHTDTAILPDEVYCPIGVYPIISAALENSGCVVSWNVVEYDSSLRLWRTYIDIVIHNPTSSPIHLTQAMLKGKIRLHSLELYHGYAGEDGQGYKQLR